jgi:hypothetical protein
VRRASGARTGLSLGLAALLLPTVANAAPQVEAEPSRLVLGASMQVRITVRGTGGRVHGVASAGTLVPVSSGDGAVRFLWTAPEARAPFVAVFAFWEGQSLALSSVTTLALACSSRTELAIDTEPGARVTVEIAGSHFGPRRADARGKLRMPVEVAPLAHEARITAEVGEQGKVRVVPLPVAPSPWVWVLEPATLAPGMEGQAMLVAPEEIPPNVLLRISGGELQREAAETNRTLYRLLPEPEASRVTLEAAFAGETKPRASATVEVVASPTVTLAPSPSPAVGRQLEVGAALGGFFAGGRNVGPALIATVSVAPWRIPISLELELGVRAAWFSSAVSGLGTASSALVVFPIEVAVRGPVWSSGRFSLELRTGGGLLLGTNWVSSDFGQSVSEAATGWEVFGAAQLNYRAGSFLPYAELRGAYAVVTGNGLTANPGGLVFLVGFHWLRSLR